MVIGLGNNTLVTLHTDILNIGNTFNILALGGILARYSFILLRGSFVHSDFYIQWWPPAPAAVKYLICPSNVALNTNPGTILKSACLEDSKKPTTC